MLVCNSAHGIYASYSNGLYWKTLVGSIPIMMDMESFSLLDEEGSVFITTEKNGLLKNIRKWNVKYIAMDSCSNDTSSPTLSDPYVDQFVLFKNFPNPFNQSTTIRYHLPIECKVTISIYNSRAQRIRKVNLGAQNSGFHLFTWDGTNDSRKFVSSGIYFYIIEAPPFKGKDKMLLIR